ncbi:MAG: hypothetical protein FJY95_23025 [Candidatus Handelsmanbacteria bacterium]|nr:hypothetical protein [Candidatus Handelsmanbacteria bacterium]
MRRGSRGSAGTLRRLGPKAPRRRAPQRLCHVVSRGEYLAAVDPERQPVLTEDPAKALRMPAEVARQAALGMHDLGLDAEVVPAGGMAG